MDEISEEKLGLILILTLIIAFVLVVDFLRELPKIIYMTVKDIWDRRRKIIFFLILYIIIKLFIF